MKKNINVLDSKSKKTRRGSILLETVIAISIVGFLAFYVNEYMFKSQEKITINLKKENIYFMYYLIIDKIDISKKNNIEKRQISEYINYDIITKEDSIKFEEREFSFNRKRLKTIYLYDNIPMSVYVDTLTMDDNKINIQRYFSIK